MAQLKLYVGNKNYSSWSLRPWLALKAAGVDFEDDVVPFDFPAGNPAIKALSDVGRVPILVDGDFRLWESLAIIDYVADLFPEKRLWPQDIRDRALARAYSLEMATGFRALRNACPMNLRRPRKAMVVGEDVLADVARIEKIWSDALARSGGPFLFGEFSAVDAMYAPVVNRFDAYMLTEKPQSRAYMQAVVDHPAFCEWAAAAALETWIVPEDEA
ncbi:glutathione S-transferase family protein [Rhizobium sp. G21]|uniref:glutathione S-transferase family protein n=1 Tax=Rhizobium sp. G21 TaxID=2758439 RepID=UPI0015FF141C|nr:glutathione S-transferase family protein [Rhizobium sp. G21]MBB1249533.1 glutathione S-transferase family protein [Rhizobium sp. G21]